MQISCIYHFVFTYNLESLKTKYLDFSSIKNVSIYVTSSSVECWLEKLNINTIVGNLDFKNKNSLFKYCFTKLWFKSQSLIIKIVSSSSVKKRDLRIWFDNKNWNEIENQYVYIIGNEIILNDNDFIRVNNSWNISSSSRPGVYML